MVNQKSKVKINIDVVLSNGLQETETQKQALQYILKHPKQVYSIKAIDNNCLAPIIINHPILSGTSFYIEEIEVINQ